ncbi:MAG: TolB family protein [Planctomycetota bacterium]|jgi:Tol biopolymer transport system component
MAKTKLSKTGIGIIYSLVLILFTVNGGVCASQAKAQLKLREAPSPPDALDLGKIPFKIVYESYRKTNGAENWELYLVNADGSNPVNLTRTSDADEMYPHASPDGRRICFVADEGTSNKKVRNIYYINIDGTGRVKVADNARQPCWGPDAKTIAYLKAEFERYTIKDYATKGLFFYDIETRKHTQHPNKNLHHLYNICWSPDGNWFLATVHGGMGFKHANLAFEANSNKVFDLTKYGVTGCRPDCSFDSSRITWGLTDWDLCTASINLKSSVPKVTNAQRVVKCTKEYEVYHSDFSPDGRYIAFSHGPKAQEMVGGKAPGWNICISDMAGKWVQITTDGNHNKEPDWVPIRTPGR